MKTPLAPPENNAVKMNILTNPRSPVHVGYAGRPRGPIEDKTGDSDDYYYHALLEDDLAEKPPLLELDHELRNFIPEIGQLALREFAVWKNDPRRFLVHGGRRIENHPMRPLAPLVPRFACPLSLVSPNRCRRCFTRCQIFTTRDLQRHLATHRLPLYCPVCYVKFSGASDRDEHIVQRNCEPRDELPTFDGISEEKLRLIAKVPVSLPAVEAWYAIWDILYADTPPPTSPWLPGEVGLHISLAGDFWAEKGQLIVSGFLESNNKLSWDMPDEERNLAALYALVLDHLIDEIFDSEDKSLLYVLGKQTSGNPGPATRTESNVGSFVLPLINKWFQQNRPRQRQLP